MKSLLALLFSFFHFLFPWKLITISFKSHHHFYSRWKRTSGGVMLDGGKKVLEFVAIQRRDNSQWAIPGVSLNYCKPSRDHSLIRSKGWRPKLQLLNPSTVANLPYRDLWIRGRERLRLDWRFFSRIPTYSLQFSSWNLKVSIYKTLPYKYDINT